jgi:sugar phosphate isomerase/epimerase
MRPGFSSYVFLQQRLRPALLNAMHRSGATAIEVFATRHHFDYADRTSIRELATWFRDTDVRPSLHQPLYPDAQWSRHVGPTLDLLDPDKSHRIAAMDEIKRVLETAEQIPFRSITLHLGMKGDAWSPRALENSLTAIEHLKAFAGPLGVQLLLETLQNEVTAPERLLEILCVGHFDTVGITLDVGHAHLTDYSNPGAGIDAAFELLRPRIAELHLHDNNGARDEHLWPGSPSTGIDWSNVQRHIAALPAEVFGILEIAHELGETAESVTKQGATFFDRLRREEEQTADRQSGENRQR